MSQTPMLVDQAFSAWSEKARWVLDWKGVAFERREFIPMIDDRWLRRISGQEEVPVLVRGGAALAGSTAIALALEAERPERPLLPDDRRLRAEAIRWQDWAGDTLSPLGRIVLMGSLVADREAALTTVPPTAPAYARMFASIAVPLGLRQFMKAYEIDEEKIAAAHATLPRHLESIAAALAPGRPYLVGDALTLADVAVASALILIAPPAEEWLPRPMAPALRRAFTSATSLARFPEVFAWRDDLYKRHRRATATPA